MAGRKIVTKWFVVLAAMSFAPGCGDGMTTPSTRMDEVLTLSVTSATLTPGESLEIRATATGQVTWRSSDPSVAAVSSQGVVAALREGEAEITASSTTRSARAKVKVGGTLTDPTPTPTPAPSPTPTPTPVGSTLVYGHDFDDGTLGQFGQWGDHVARPASVVDDPTGSGHGKVVRVDYVHNPASDASHDVNHSIFYNPNPPGGDPVSMSWGERVYWRGDLWLPEYPGGRPAHPEYDMRKLLYPKFGNPDTGRWSAFVVGLWGRADGSGMDLSLSSGRSENNGYEMKYGIAPISWRTWNTLEVEFQINSRGKADGWIKIWVNGVLRYERTNLLLFSAQADPSTERIFEFPVGNQEQWESKEKMGDYRLWDNIQFRTSRP